MIVSDLAGLASQAELTPQMQMALDFLLSVRGRQLADGKIDVDGERVFAIVQSYDTLGDGEWAFEGHRRYIDIQYVASGREVIGWAPLDTASVSHPYDAGKDVCWVRCRNRKSPLSDCVRASSRCYTLLMLMRQSAHGVNHVPSRRSL